MQISLKDFLVGIDLASSKSEANRLIKGNAIQIFKETEDGHEEIKGLNINTVFIFEEN